MVQQSMLDHPSFLAGRADHPRANQGDGASVQMFPFSQGVTTVAGNSGRPRREVGAPGHIANEIHSEKVRSLKLSKSSLKGKFTEAITQVHKAMYDNEPEEKVKAVFIRLNARHDAYHQETKRYLGLLGDTDMIESRLVTLEARDISDQFRFTAADVKSYSSAPSAQHSSLPGGTTSGTYVSNLSVGQLKPRPPTPYPILPCGTILQH